MKKYFTLLQKSNKNNIINIFKNNKEIRDYYKKKNYLKDSYSLDLAYSLANENVATPLTLQQIKSFSVQEPKKRIQTAIFLHKELSIRISKAIVKLFELPIGLHETPSVKTAINIYMDFLNQLQYISKPNTTEKEINFTKLIWNFKNDGSRLVPLICQGLQEMKETDLGRSALKLSQVQKDISDKLDDFFLFRIGIRLIAGQHVESLYKPGGRIEICDVKKIIEKASKLAKKLCKQYYNRVSDVEIKIIKQQNHKPFVYVTSHLHHMIFELVKNSMRASIQINNSSFYKRKDTKIKKLNHVMDINSPNLGFIIPEEIPDGVHIYPGMPVTRNGKPPRIKIIINQGMEDLTIKIADEAGGICRSDWTKLWFYTYTTCNLNNNHYFYSHDSDSPYRPTFREHFSGGGYGLPISRLFARYFGGELTLVSSEGYGTDAYIHVPRLGNQTAELIPGDNKKR